MTAAHRRTRLPLREAPEEGAVRMLDVGGHRVGLYRVGGSFYALADRCPHRGGPLCSAGWISTPVQIEDDVVALGRPKSTVRCPWHKWEFEITTGRCRADSRLRVRRYAVHVDGKDVVVTLEHPPGE